MKCSFKKCSLTVCAILISFVLVSCNDAPTPEDPHEHTYSEDWSSDETNHWHEPTCEDTDEVSDKAKHTWDNGTITSEASCTAEGKKTYTCKVCAATKSETIEKVAHTWDEGAVVTAPNCTEKGKNKFTCSVCSATEEKEVAALGHKEVKHSSSVEPTIFTKGTYVGVCSVCNTQLKNEIVPELYSTPIDVNTGKPATKDSEYVYFGIFPKTIKSSDTSAVDKSSENKVTMGDYTYYPDFDGNYYAEITENGKGISDTYYDAKFKYSDGTTAKTALSNVKKYFKVEPIKWKVVSIDDNGKTLLVAEDVITAYVPYFDTINERTILNNTVYANNYKESTIRAYLNGTAYYSDTDVVEIKYNNKGFINSAFIPSAQALILDTTVDNGGDSTTQYVQTETSLPKADGTCNWPQDPSDEPYKDYTCSNTTDKIFLLSVQEITCPNYGFSTAADRLKKATDFAVANYAYANANENCNWFLRSPNYEAGKYITIISSSGLNNATTPNTPSNGIVPALCIELE